jgi:pimeloyl-ACP methyl ester carboxylesterase
MTLRIGIDRFTNSTGVRKKECFMKAESSSLKSTTQFYGHMGFAMRAVRGVLWLGQALGPRIGVPLATRIFLTPLPLKWLQKRKPWDTGWSIKRSAFENASITLHRHETQHQQNGIALLVHGWGGHAGQMLPIANALIGQGIAPIILETPAHGRNAGATTAIPQFARAVEFTVGLLAKEGVATHALIGHSAGATACAFAASRATPEQKPALKLVMIAAPERPQQYTEWFAQIFGLRETTRAAMQARIEATHGLRMSQFDFTQLAPQIASPTLVVHDENDPLHASAAARVFATNVLQAKFLETKGLGHARILRDRNIGERIAVFLK